MSSRQHASLSDVAKAAGVSLATASRAMNSAYGVAAKTRERVLAAADELDYIASPDASGLARGASRRVALVVPHINRWFFGEMVSGIERITSQADIDLLLYHVDDENFRRGFFERLPARRKVQAMVIVAFPVDHEESRRLELMGVEIIAAGGQSTDYPYVCIDDHEAARLAVEHLTTLGHRRIAMLSALEPAVPDWPLMPGRRQGYLDALAAAGIAADPSLTRKTDWNLRGDAAAAAMHDILDSAEEPPTAVFAHSDELAIAAIAAMRSRGLRIPEDVSVVGIDDHPLAGPIGLTTVRQEVREQGELAGRMVLDALGLDGGGVAERAIVSPVSLVVRESTAPPAR